MPMIKELTGTPFSATLLAIGACFALSGAAFAQAPPRTRGTITAVSGDTLTLRTVMGQMTANLAADTKVVGAKKASLDDVKSNTFIGTAAVPQTDGTLRALEVTVFPESMRGSGEGNYPWDLGKSGSMTNGSVSSMTNGSVGKLAGPSSMTNGAVSAMSGSGTARRMTVTYKGGEKTVVVPSNVPVVELEPGDRSMLKPGAKVVVFGPVNGTTAMAKRIVIGEDGVKPPM
jgi:hypothetical protein